MNLPLSRQTAAHVIQTAFLMLKAKNKDNALH